MPPETGAPWLGPLLNILQLEQKRGFDDRSVIGGLDGFTSHWSPEIISQTSNVRLVRRLLGASYRNLSPEQRAKWTGEWLTLLSAEGKASPAENTEQQAPAGPAARRANSPATPSKTPSKTPPKTQSRPKAARRASTPGSLSLDETVDKLRGVDTKLSARLKRLEVTTVRDLLYLFPRRHTDYSQATKIADLSPGIECTVVGTVWEAREVSRGPQGKRQDCEAVLSDDTGNVRVAWFGQRYLARTLKPNTRIAVSGRVNVFNGQLVFQSPEYELLDSGQAGIHTGRMVPVYPLTEGLTGRRLARDYLAGPPRVAGRG